MQINGVMTAAVFISMYVTATSAWARNWLAPVPEARASISDSVLTPTGTAINFGPRARVRVYRPDGIYEMDGSPILPAHALEREGVDEAIDR
ncbi:MAG: hypothetical protein WC829_13000 [Hyphomicrobium sp.]